MICVCKDILRPHARQQSLLVFSWGPLREFVELRVRGDPRP